MQYTPLKKYPQKKYKTTPIKYNPKQMDTTSKVLQSSLLMLGIYIPNDKMETLKRFVSLVQSKTLLNIEISDLVFILEMETEIKKTEITLLEIEKVLEKTEIEEPLPF